MNTDHDARIAALERNNRRYRIAMGVLVATLAGVVMLGLMREDEPTINGFSAVMDQQGAITYLRLVDRDTVETLDTSRGDRWFWRRIRNWPK